MSEQANHHHEDDCTSTAQRKWVSYDCIYPELKLRKHDPALLFLQFPVFIFMGISTNKELEKYSEDKFNLLKYLKGKETIKADNISAFMKKYNRVWGYILV